MACTPDSSKGGCYPRVNFDQDGDCSGPVGGTKTVGMPAFALEVTNPPSAIWVTEELEAIVDAATGELFVFDNI